MATTEDIWQAVDAAGGWDQLTHEQKIYVAGEVRKLDEATAQAKAIKNTNNGWKIRKQSKRKRRRRPKRLNSNRARR